MSLRMRIVCLCSLLMLTGVAPVTLWADEESDIKDPGYKTIAIWDFENSTVPGMGEIVENSYLIRTVPEMITAKMVDIPELKIVERVHLREAMEELKLGSSTLADPKSRLRLGKISGAKFMIFGDYMVMGPAVQFAVRVVDVETSLMVFVDNQNGPLDTVAQMVDTLAANVARTFAAGNLSTTQFSWKQDMDVWKRQEHGLSLIDKRQYGAAIKVFEKILKNYPKFAPAKRQIQMAKLGDDYRNGLDFLKTKKYSQAVVAFKKVLMENPAFAPARQNLKKALQLKRQAQ